MKALVYKGPETLAYDEFDDPEPAPDERLIRVDSVGICGSDMHAYLGHDERRPAPLILGHEVAGTVVETGQRVTVNPLVTCGKCCYCLEGRDNLCTHRQIISMPPREGGFAQFLTMPERNLVAVPDDVSSDKAALAEPIACGWHGARMAEAIIGKPENALVIGGGAIGVGAALSLAAQGCEQVMIVEPSADRRHFLDAQAGLASAAPDQIGDDQLYDVVVDAVGIEASRAQASSVVRPGGVIIHIGLGSAQGGLDVRRMTLQEISFVGTYTYTSEDFRQTAAALFDGRLGALDWTEQRPLSEGARAFGDLRAGRVDAPKIILKP